VKAAPAAGGATDTVQRHGGPAMNLIRRTPRGLSALDPFAGFDSLFENFM
jgi:hypothetical protein